MKDWIILKGNIQSYLSYKSVIVIGLFLADSEHFCAAGWAYALGSRFAILHGDGFGVAHFFLLSALHTVGLHNPSFLVAICNTQ